MPAMSEETSPQLPRRSAQILRFTTRGISPPSRVQLWEGHNHRALIPLDVRTIDSAPMHAQQINLHLTSVRIADVFATPQLVERSENFINDHPTGMVVIFFITGGESFFFHRGGHIQLRPGQAIAYDADRPFVHGVSHGFRELALTIPRKLYMELIGSDGPGLPAVFNFDTSANTPEQALARRLRKALNIASALTLDSDGSTQPDSRAELARVEGDALGLLRSVLVSPAGSTRGLVSMAQDFIASRLHDPDLSPGEVAAAVGVSTRQLARFFAELDITVGRYIQATRLELARDLLASPEYDRLSVAEVAVQCGFRSRSNFSTSFRTRYGLAPLEWRKAARREYLKP